MNDDGPGSPAGLVEALHNVFGRHHARPAHAKGLLLEGSFNPTPAARGLCAATLFAEGMVPVIARFSNSTGLPDIADTAPEANPRGLAVRFHLHDGAETDLVTHSFDGFPVKTGEEFGVFLRAVAASGPAAPKPTALDRFLSTHPETVRFLTTQKPAPVSWATLVYFGVNAFRFTDGQRRDTHVRYRLVPRAGEQLLDASALPTKGPNYLSEEIAARVQQGLVVFDWFAQLAQPADALDDPTTAWPEDRQLVNLGTITLGRVSFDQQATAKAIGFLPGRLPAGMAAVDPLVAIRDAVYRIAYAERQ